MARPTLSGCWAKLARAQELLDALEPELADYVESEPYDISTNTEQRGAWLVLKYERVPEAPLRLGVIVGEIAHDIRSALDHLVWQLVRLNGGHPDEQTAFPISDRRRPRGRPRRRIRYWTAEKGRCLKGVDPLHVKVIEDAQPFQDGRRAHSHPLWLLTSLWNVDKHRIIHTAFLNVPEEFPMDVSMDIGGFANVGVELRSVPGRIERGADAVGVRVVSAPWGSPKHMEVSVSPPVSVHFGKRGVRTRNLRQIGWFVSQRVIGRFEDAFPWELHPSGTDRPFHELPPPPAWPGQRVALGRPEDTNKRFDGWKVWFDVGQWRMASPASPVEQTPPAWYLQGPTGLIVEVACVDLRVEEFVQQLREYLPENVLADVLEWFEPMERQIGPTLGVVVTPS